MTELKRLELLAMAGDDDVDGYDSLSMHIENNGSGLVNTRIADKENEVSFKPTN